MYTAREEIIWEVTQINTRLWETVVSWLICNCIALEMLLRGKKPVQVVVAWNIIKDILKQVIEDFANAKEV